MAHLSEDKNMVEAFREGSDIHAATAAKIWHEEISQVTDTQRKKAKTANFGIIYGITTFGLAQRMNIENKEAKQIIEDYFRTFPGVKAYMEKSKEIAREKGYAETISIAAATYQTSIAAMVQYAVLPNAMPSMPLSKVLRPTSSRLRWFASSTDSKLKASRAK